MKATILGYLIMLFINKKIREDHSNSYPNNIFLHDLKGPLLHLLYYLLFK